MPLGQEWYAVMLLSKLFFWLSAGLGTLLSWASRWEDLMVWWGEGSGVRRVKEVLKERSVLS